MRRQSPKKSSNPNSALPEQKRSVEDYLANYPSAREVVAESGQTIVVIGQHRYYQIFSAQLVQAQTTKDGQLKNPLQVVNPLDYIWKAKRPEELKFYAAIAKFQNYYEKSQADLEALRMLFRNPVRYDFYLHDHDISEKVNARSVSPVSVSIPRVGFTVRVSKKKEVFTAVGQLVLNGIPVPLEEVNLQLHYFLVRQNHWYLCENLELLRSINYFLQEGQKQTFTCGGFREFRHDLLDQMEHQVEVEHTYRKKARKSQLKKAGLDQAPRKMIYLSDHGDYVCIEPVMSYGGIEIPLLSKKQIELEDTKGNPLSTKRNLNAEDLFIAQLTRQHPHFVEQLDNPLLYFYLHKTRFLDENWFLDAFEEWRESGVTILGFNKIEGNKLNQHKASVDIEVTSGLNWFNTDLDVRFGNKKAGLKKLKKAVVNKSKYVELDDGTEGIIPEEWLEKFADYFHTATVMDDLLKIPKSNFSAITELYEEQMLDEEVKREIAHFQNTLEDFRRIEPVPPPKKLKADLRPYQRLGLSWLNFLDDFNFGGCLADDMGLGKTVQIIAFILQLEKKYGRQTHLLVLPTSLIHNWKNELYRFAPHLKTVIHHGPVRDKTTDSFLAADLVITTYNTLVSDISFLRKFRFEYVFADESQNLKNTNSQRYKAARLLTSRNSVVITGTPVENNTFDLYAQMSFINPGLLGNKTFFRHTYAIPIDKFEGGKRAQELHQKVSPFILRRTKKEVAKELPEKTETVLYCDMGTAQREVYEAYEKEFREYISAHSDDELDKNPMHVLRGITRLRQICNSPLLIGEDQLQGETSVKIQVLMEQLRSITGNHKVLIFSQFVGMLNLIQKELEKEAIGFSRLTGSTTNRGAVVDQFQNEESTRVFLISLKAGGTGLNLTAADYVFLIDPWWNPAVENQAIDRVYRIGQEKHVIAVRLICSDTVEEKIQTLQQRKADLTDQLLSSNASFFKSLNREDLIALIKK